MTNRVRSGIYFGVLITVGLIAQNVLTLPMYNSYQVLRSILTGLAAGLLAGILFGWLIGARWLSKLADRMTKQRQK